MCLYVDSKKTADLLASSADSWTFYKVVNFDRSPYYMSHSSIRYHRGTTIRAGWRSRLSCMFRTLLDQDREVNHGIHVHVNKPEEFYTSYPRSTASGAGMPFYIEVRCHKADLIAAGIRGDAAFTKVTVLS